MTDAAVTDTAEGLEAAAEQIAAGEGRFPVNVERGEVAVPSTQAPDGWWLARFTHAAEEMAEALLPGRQIGEVLASMTMGGGLRAVEVTAVLWASLEAGWSDRQGTPVDALSGARFKRRDVLALVDEMGRVHAEELVMALLVLAAPRRELVAALDEAQAQAGARPLVETATMIATGGRIGVNFDELWSALASSILSASGVSPPASASSSS